MLERFGYKITERTPDATKEDLMGAVEFVHERPRPEPPREKRTSMDDAIEAWLKKEGIETHGEDGLLFFLVTDGARGRAEDADGPEWIRRAVPGKRNPKHR